LSKIKEENWADLVGHASVDPEALRKDNRSKYLGSIAACSVYLVFAYVQALETDQVLIYAWYINLSIFLLLNQLAKTQDQLANILEASKYPALGILPVTLYFLPAPEAQRFVYVYTFVYFVFIQDYYHWQPVRYYGFAFCSFVGAVMMVDDLKYQLTLLAVMLFITFVSRTIIIMREENLKLGQLRSSFKVFIKHKNLIDHHVLNGISKISFHKLMIDKARRENKMEDIEEHASSIQTELDAIETALRETDSDQINEFDLGIDTK